jgi:hypothetical protein
MELFFLDLVNKNKEKVNPLNIEETFTCKDLYKDYLLCRRKRSKLHMNKFPKSKKCWDLRVLAIQCFTYSDDQFAKEIMKKYEETKRFIKHLEDEGSVLAQKYRLEKDIYSINHPNE